MLSIVAHGILGTAYRQDVVVDEGASRNGDIIVLKDIRHLLSKEYGDDTPMTGWCLQPAHTGMWISRIERVFDTNYMPAYVMVSFLLPFGYKLRKEAIQRIEYCLLVNHEKYVQQSVALFDADWRFLQKLNAELQEDLFEESCSYSDSILFEKAAFCTSDITSMLNNIWDSRFRQFGIVFCGKRILNQNKDFISIDESTEQSGDAPENIGNEPLAVDDVQDSYDWNDSDNGDSTYTEFVESPYVEEKEEEPELVIEIPDENVESGDDANGGDANGDADDAKMVESVVPVSYTSKRLMENTSIGSWLSFFLTIILLGGLFGAIYPIATYNSADYSDNVWLGAVDVVLGLSLFGVASYSVCAFWKRKRNAVFYMMLYVALVAIKTVIDLLGSEDTFTTVCFILKLVAWCGGLVLFFFTSNQVKHVIPASFRKVSRLDWGIFSAVLAVPIILVGIAYASLRKITTERAYDSIVMLLADIEENERTDGRVIFTIPEDFLCVSEDVDLGDDQTLELFTLSDGYGSTCNMCSDYDSDSSLSNFGEYWTGWSETTLDGCSYSLVEEDYTYVNGNLCRYRTVKTDIDDILYYWHFYVMFNHDKGKCCVISCIDNYSDSAPYVDSLLESIRFEVTDSDES